jgi:hypothetical protein
VGGVPRDRIDQPRPTSTIDARNTGAGLTIDPRTITPHCWNDPLQLGDIIASREWHDQHGEVA